MEAAIFGLLGVALGAVLTLFREWWFQSRKDRKDAEYLAVVVSCALDTYAARCADVVADDGLSYGQPDEDGYHRVQVDAPVFTPDTLNVEWKSLPAKLMYRILDLPNQATEASHKVDGAFEYAATPPDFGEGFEERHMQYASLGLQAAELAKELRKRTGLPQRAYDQWNPIEFMSERKAEIFARRAERERRHVAPNLPAALSSARTDA
jgi:hypothetical protein